MGFCGPVRSGGVGAAGVCIQEGLVKYGGGGGGVGGMNGGSGAAGFYAKARERKHALTASSARTTSNVNYPSNVRTVAFSAFFGNWPLGFSGW